MSAIEIIFLTFGIMVFISIFLLMYSPSTLESKETEVVAEKNLSEETADFIKSTTDPTKWIVTAFFVSIGFIFIYPIISTISNYSPPIRYILISSFYIIPFLSIWYKIRFNNNWFIAVIIFIFFVFGFIHLSKFFEKKYGAISNHTSENIYSEKEIKNSTPQVSSAMDLAKQATGQSKHNQLTSADDSVPKNNIKNQNTVKMELTEKNIAFGKMSLDEQIEYLGEARKRAKKELTEVEAQKVPCTNAICEAQERLRETEKENNSK